MSSLLSPYQVIDSSEHHITYEYRTAYTWTLYAILVLLLAGVTLENNLLATIAAIATLLYFAAKLLLGNKVAAQIKQAMRSGGVQITGSRTSFNDPLRIRVPL